MVKNQIKNILKNKKVKDLAKADDILVGKHPEWSKLTASERGKNKNENKFLIVMKNLCPSWKESDKDDYVSDAVFQTELLPKLNWINNGYLGSINGNSYFSDKNYQPLFLSGIKMPKTIIRKINGILFDGNYCILSFREALEKIKKYDQLVFKVSIGSSHGKGVKLVDLGDYEEQLEKFGDNIIIQEKIKQSSFLSHFNDSSVNILRITTIIINSAPYILSSILRVGAPGSFCDHQGFRGTNPRIIKIDKDGKLVGPAIDPDDGFVYDDIFGKKIEGAIPNFNNICDDLKRECLRLAHTKIIGWDLTLDKNNNSICVEFNNVYPGIVQSQMVCGPIFAQKTKNGDKIIDLIKTDKF